MVAPSLNGRSYVYLSRRYACGRESASSLCLPPRYTTEVLGWLVDVLRVQSKQLAAASPYGISRFRRHGPCRMAGK